MIEAVSLDPGSSWAELYCVRDKPFFGTFSRPQFTTYLNDRYIKTNHFTMIL